MFELISWRVDDEEGMYTQELENTEYLVTVNNQGRLGDQKLQLQCCPLPDQVLGKRHILPKQRKKTKQK